MNLNVKNFLVALALIGTPGNLEVAANPSCGLIAPDLLEDVAVEVSYKGKVPTINTDAGSYNMMVAENFDDALLFIDQKEGILYKYGASETVEKIYDVTENVVELGIQVDITFPPYGYSALDKKIHNVAPGPGGNTIFMVVTSAVLPPDHHIFGGMAALELPDDFEYNFEDVGDCTNVTVCFAAGSPLCCFGQTVYKLFYEFDLNLDATDGNFLSNPRLFFALEMQNTLGHDGGAMLTIPDDGRVLYSVGDCLPYGLNGLYASQDSSSHCGKMLLIDPVTPGSYDIVASGIRNSQQMNLEGDYIVFMDIGGVTAEEVNAVQLADLLDLSQVENFGWGMVRGEVGKTDEYGEYGREGTFIVGRGQMLQFGNPPCLAQQTGAEKNGFVPPFMQYGRSPGTPLFGITSAIVSDVSFGKIKVATSEFKTGTMIVALEDVVGYVDSLPVQSYKPAQSYFVKLYKKSGTGNLEVLSYDFNTLVAEFLGLDPENDDIRGDSRLFKYPDGSAGVFIERTGQFFELSEIDIM